MAKETTYDMTKGNPVRLLILFTIPMLLGNIFQQLYSSIDSIVVGHFVSVEAMAAIGATSSMWFFFLNMAVGLGNGLGIVMSQYFGAKNEKMLQKTAANALLITVAAAGVMGGLGLILSRPLLELMQTPADIIDMSHLYISICFGGMICMLGYNVTASILRALGNSRAPLYFLIFSSVLNIILDLLFVLLFHWDVAGVAIATLVAQAVSALLSIAYIYRHYPVLRFKLHDMKPNFEIIGRVIKIGLPMSLQSGCFAAGMMVIQATINSYGTTVVAGYTAAVRVETLTWMIPTTIGTSISNYAGQNAGAKDIDRIQKGVKAAVKICIIASAASTVFVYLTGTSLLKLFIDNEPEILKVAQEFLFVNATFYMFIGLIMIYNGTLRGIGDIGLPMISAFIELFLKVGGSLLFSYLFGYFGIWFAEPLGWIIGTIPSAIYYYRGGWKKKVLDLKV
ncbi:MAG: MATE family efflux transporter [Firmicutes bacterium]|nr:MATE family efflux transporter [Bacillota bacterium]